MVSMRHAHSLQVITGETVDERLLVRLAKQDPAAFASLYDRYAEPIYALCLHRLGNATLAEDAASQVFERALTRLHQCRDESFRGWLFQIAYSVSTDMIRGRHAESVFDDAIDRAAPGPTPEEAAIAADDKARLDGWLLQLQPDQRRVIELRLRGLKGQEIARVMERSHEAVRMLQFRALKQLRLLMTAEQPGGEYENG